MTTTPPEMLTPAEIDKIFDAHQEAPQMAFRYLVSEALQQALLARLSEQQPVQLDHIACIEDGKLRYMSGRCAPAHDCELYAMPNGGRAPALYAAPVPTPAAQAAQAVPADTQLLDFLAAESLDLRCFTVSDDDVGWRTVQHHQGRPAERVASEVYCDDPRQAIRAAMQHLERDPYCTGPLHQDEAALTPTGAGDEGGA